MQFKKKKKGKTLKRQLIYSLNGDNSELGSTQKPTNAWKNSISSCNWAVFTISRRYRRDSAGAWRSIRDKMLWHCVRRNSAGGPRMPTRAMEDGHDADII